MQAFINNNNYFITGATIFPATALAAATAGDAK